MLIIGVVISGNISDNIMEEQQKYNTALQINDDKELFEYGMRTNVGNAFVYGNLQAVDTVTYPEIGDEYMAVEKVREEYTMHTRTYTTTDSNGRTQTHTQVYWTWDYAGSEYVQCEEVSFCGVVFDSDKIDLPYGDYLNTIKVSSHVRYKYYVVGTNYTGTIFTDLKDNTISDGTNFYNNRTIEETIEALKTNAKLVIFWIFWIILIGVVVAGFYFIDNRWLEDKRRKEYY